MEYHLAQINIAQAKASLESEVMKGFVSRIEEINSLADMADGFIWRLITEDGANSRIFNDPSLVINISVWKDIESLKRFVYQSVHLELIKGKAGWFHKLKASHQALWWIPAGHIPTEKEGKEKLDYLEKHGPSEKVFTFSKNFKKNKHNES
ncbi:MAG: DUF3291 domain-containing protein [Cellvibrionaceae bacterium]